MKLKKLVQEQIPNRAQGKSNKTNKSCKIWTEIENKLKCEEIGKERIGKFCIMRHKTKQENIENKTEQNK